MIIELPRVLIMFCAWPLCHPKNSTDSTAILYIAGVFTKLNLMLTKLLISNLMCHRYLLQKARALSERKGEEACEKLEKYFKWERWALLFVPIFLSFFLAGFEQLALVMGALCAVITFAIDTIFSITTTKIFLRPIGNILKIMSWGKGKDTYARLATTKYMTMAGAVVCVWSSTLLYTNAVFYAFYFDKLSNEFNGVFNPFVSGIYILSMARSVGMVLANGFFRDTLQHSLYRLRRKKCYSPDAS
jgi:hypothetical protein